MLTKISRTPAWLLTVLFSALTCPAAPTFHVLSETTLCPVAQSRLCIGDNDTCIYSDSAGTVPLDFLIANGAFAKLTANGYHDTVFLLDSAITDTVSILLKAVADGGSALLPDGWFEDTVENLGPTPADTAAIDAKTFTNEDQCSEIVVQAPKAKRCEDRYRQSLVQFTSHDIKTRAGAVEDISRYIGTLPSALSMPGEEYDNTFMVRGGRPSEVIFIVDGIEMENINHFSKANGSGGPIGFINAEYVDTVKYYAGNMPVDYPSKMSSVVDITMRDGLAEKSSRSIGGKLTGGMLTASGPIVSGKGAYAFSGRYVDFVPLRTFIKDEGVPKLGDLFGKVVARPNAQFGVSATGLLSYNLYRYSYPIIATADNDTSFNNSLTENDRILQGGAGISLHYTAGPAVHEAHLSYSFRNGSTANTLGSFSDTFFTHRYAGNPITENGDDRRRFALNTRTQITLKESHAIVLGLRAARNEYAFSQADQSQFDGNCIYCQNDTPISYYTKERPVEHHTNLAKMETGIFLDYSYNRGILSGAAGIRADYYQLLGDGAVSPRFSLALHPDRLGVFTASGGLYHQFPVEMPSLVFDALSSTPGMSNDSLRRLELALLQEAQPERCWQASLGYDKAFPHALEVKIEAYYKWYDREFNYLLPDIQAVYGRDDGGNISLAKQRGDRKAYGIETFLGSPVAYKNFFYSSGISLFDVKNRYGGGPWFNDWTNVGYTYSLSLGARVFESHTLSLAVQGAGGRPFCPETIVFDCINRKYAAPDSGAAIFSRRLGRLVMANARYSFTRRIRGASVESSMEILNILNYKPTLGYRFNGDRFIAVKPFSFTPIVGFTVGW